MPLSIYYLASIHFDKLDPLDKNVQIPDIESKICHKFDQWLIVKLVELVDKVESDMHNYEYTDVKPILILFKPIYHLFSITWFSRT